MIEFEVSGQKYRADRLGPMKQLVVARRLLPALQRMAHPSMLPIIQSMRETGKTGLTFDQVIAVLPVLSDALSSLSDEDCETVIMIAMSVVSRLHAETNAWQPLTVNSGARPVLAFQDLTLPAMLVIANSVIQDSLGSFFADARSASSGRATGGA